MIRNSTEWLLAVFTMFDFTRQPCDKCKRVFYAATSTKFCQVCIAEKEAESQARYDARKKERKKAQALVRSEAIP